MNRWSGAGLSDSDLQLRRQVDGLAIALYEFHKISVTATHVLLVYSIVLPCEWPLSRTEFALRNGTGFSLVRLSDGEGPMLLA